MKWSLDYFFAEIARFALAMKKFDSDVVESGASISAGDVGEVAGGIADLAVGHHDAGLGPALDSVYNVGGAKRNIKVGNIVLVEKRGVMREEAHTENADVFVFEDEMVMGFFGERDGDWCLGRE